jgi:hypothetical protein
MSRGRGVNPVSCNWSLYTGICIYQFSRRIDVCKQSVTNRAIGFPRLHNLHLKLLLGITIAVVILLLTTNARANDIGLRWDFSGGPLFALAGELDLSEKWTLNFDCGGFPAIILRGGIDLRYYTGRRWPSYWQIGHGRYWFFRGQGEGKHLNEFHLRSGISREFSSNWNWFLDIGLLWAPLQINSWIQHEFPDAIPVVPLAGVGIMRRF